MGYHKSKITKGILVDNDEELVNWIYGTWRRTTIINYTYMNIDNLETESFIKKTQHYHLRPYHLRSIILNFGSMSVENTIIYNYSYDKEFVVEKRHTDYFIEISYLTLDRNFVESEKMESYLIKTLKKEILLNRRNDLTPIKREIKVEKLHKKLKKLKLL